MTADHTIYQPYRFNRLAKAAQLRASSAAHAELDEHQSDVSDLLLADMPQIMAAINRFTVMFNAWNDHGRQVFDMAEPMQALAGTQVAAPAQIPDDGYPEAFYVHFGLTAGLKTKAGDFIDGALVILSSHSGKSSLHCAFVCGSDASGITDDASLARILRTQGRLAFAAAPLADLSAITLSQTVGDPMVSSDEVMSEAVTRLLLALSYLAEPMPKAQISNHETIFKPF
ncbi:MULTISPECIES: hypothetical protein [Rhizobium]|uniref:Uncharacterized protein n=1 Tax=Rhizobium ruizarguesonis TaxID=2081791 RepID=A0AAE8QBY1_9HYPH|nr:hypothetical protein [Rhizobium ruizarguesonis]TBD09914.1 hypothetical protein ELH23_33490 [Rhizobium ruizarguesonis]TBF18994.1 hypothetical protein ELG94_12060 [Rhizobium ruizarguesonis]